MLKQVFKFLHIQIWKRSLLCLGYLPSYRFHQVIPAFHKFFFSPFCTFCQ